MYLALMCKGHFIYSSFYSSHIQATVRGNYKRLIIRPRCFHCEEGHGSYFRLRFCSAHTLNSYGSCVHDRAVTKRPFSPPKISFHKKKMPPITTSDTFSLFFLSAQIWRDAFSFCCRRESRHKYLHFISMTLMTSLPPPEREKRNWTLQQLLEFCPLLLST